ncbi:MAG TPA: hypothetical protein VKJ67_18145 [Methylomirabilota bacterium]|nr:hypothetical protein [Methylomirabilota bacterium]
MRFRLGVCLIILSLAAVAFAGSDRPITSVKSLAGEWRALGGASAAAIRIKPDGAYEGTAANGARTVGRITIVDGKASFQSANSAGRVTWIREGGNDVLLFVRGDGRGSAKLERVNTAERVKAK